MRTLFENWKERKKFLVNRFFVENGKMHLKELRERDDKLDKILIVLDKKSLTDNANILADVSSTIKLVKVVPLA